MLKHKFPNRSYLLKHSMTLFLLRNFFRRSGYASMSAIIFCAIMTDLLSVLAPGGGLYFVKFVLFPIGLIILSWEEQRGIRKILETLPLFKEILTKSIWLEGVVFCPLLFLVCCLIFALPVMLVTGYSIVVFQSIMMCASMLSVMAMGFSATLIYAQNCDFSDIFQNLKKLLWTLAGIPVVILLVLHPVSEVNVLRQILVLMLCAITLVISYASHNELLSETIAMKIKRKEISPSYYRSPFSFWLGFWAPQVMGVLLCFIMLSTIYIAKIFLLNKSDILEDNYREYCMIFWLFIPATSISWMREIQLLRTLPMTSKQLSLFLIAIPVVNTIFAVIFSLILFVALGAYEEMSHILLFSSYSVGCSVIFYNIAARCGWLGFVCCLVISAQFAMHSLEGVLFPISLVGLMTIPLLMYQIKNSSAIYRNSSSWMKSSNSPRRR